MTQYYCRRGPTLIPIALDPCFARGGEGKIQPVRQLPGFVAKIFHKPSVQRRHKLEIMIANPCGSSHASVAWPQYLIFAEQHFAGYLMPRVAGVPAVELFHPKSRRFKCPQFNYRYLLRSTINLVKTVHRVHSLGLVIGDLNELSALVDAHAYVYLVDADSWQVRDPKNGNVAFRCTVGKPDFTPPELQGRNFALTDRTEIHDRFGLAVLIFKFLMEGTHPCDGVYLGSGEAPSIEARIAAGHFPCSPRLFLYTPKPMAPPFQHLHPRVQTLFMQCFQNGRFDPRHRPSAHDWIYALQEAEDSLVQCRFNPEHWHGRHLARCPWCERKILLRGLDPFPSTRTAKCPVGRGVPLGRQPTPIGVNQPGRQLSAGSRKMLTLMNVYQTRLLRLNRQIKSWRHTFENMANQIGAKINWLWII